MATFPLHLPAIKVSQPLGDFFVVALDAATLRQVTFLDPTRVTSVDYRSFWYSLLGAQRQSSPRRAKEIGKYIDTVEAAFPNSIILAANYINYGELQEDEEKRWRIQSGTGHCFDLVLPTGGKMASVVDGQHRLLGFEYSKPERQSMQLLCAVYMDLPHAYQAYLFATININQRKVDKSLAYDQFGYNLDEEEKDGWAPDKLAVSISRKLNLDPSSPFYNHIKIAPMNSDLLFPNDRPPDWQVSMACVVEGIARLISQKPREDRDFLHTKAAGGRSRSLLLKDSSPLRELYLTNQDEDLYRLLMRFFTAAKETYWESANARSYIRKTVGIQALFDVLRACLARFGTSLSAANINAVLKPSKGVDFSSPAYQASGRGRSLVRNTILIYANMLKASDKPDTDRPIYQDLLRKFPKPTDQSKRP
jgi:DNA phosphorothioation-associated DGQHR protein 1